MKITHRKKVLTLFVLSLSMFVTLAQAPQGFSYQAVVRNGSGVPIVDQFVGVEITLQNTLGVALYTETHWPKTNAQGVISITIGEGTLVGGKTFASVPWKAGDVLVKVRIDPAGGTAYTQIGEPTELKSVPYALFAENTKEVVSKPDAATDDPIFEVKNKLGQVVFGVYQGGVRVYVEDTQIKGAKGGFAVGGLSQTKAGNQPFYLKITPDTARININDSNTPKGAKGGFAVGGLSQTKAGGYSEYLRITPDSARIYVDDNATKGAKGGFAVGGLSQTKGTNTKFLDLTPRNYFFGHNTGTRTTGLYNSFIGYESGSLNITGENNVFLGYHSGYNNDASNNTFIGYQSGNKNTNGEFNSFMGYNTGFSNTIGEYNCFWGTETGYSNQTGRSNIFIGNKAGYSGTAGNDNIFLGYKTGYSNMGNYNIMMGDESGYTNTVGEYNIFMGFQSGNKNTTGSKNYFIGYRSGYNNISGYSNVFIGDSAGFTNNSGSHNIFIGNQSGINNSGGHNNTACGYLSLNSNTINNGNTAFGFGALWKLSSGNGNTAVGTMALSLTTSATDNTALGFNAFLSSDPLIKNSTALGANAIVSISNQVMIGSPFVGLIGGAVGWSIVSDGRFKNIVAEQVKGLDFITRLSPVVYTFDTQKFDEFLMKNVSLSMKNESMSKKDYTQSKAIKRSGFVAQDVEKAAKESGYLFNGVHHPENDNDNYSIDYSLLTVPLVKAVQELNTKNEELQKQVDTLKAELEAIKALLKK